MAFPPPKAKPFPKADPSKAKAQAEAVRTHKPKGPGVSPGAPMKPGEDGQGC